MTIRDTMMPQYNFREEGDVLFLQVKSEDDFGYRLRPVTGGFRLDKAFSPRIYIKPTYKKVKDFASVDAALTHIVKHHNKSCEWMKNWKTIEL